MNGVKIALLYIGAIVGAGFATGREVVIFFGYTNVWSPLLAGVILGVLCAVFLIYGRTLHVASLSYGNIVEYEKVKNKDIEVSKNKDIEVRKNKDIEVSKNKDIEVRKNNAVFFGKLLAKNNNIFEKISKNIMCICAIVSYACMCAGGETIIFDCFAIRNIGLLTGVVSAVLSIGGMKFIKQINFLLVPIIFVIVVFFAVDAPNATSRVFSALAPLKYCAMNITLGGCVIAGQGEKASKKDIIIASILSGILFAIMLSAIFSISNGYASASMPMFEFAKAKGFKISCGIVIFLAIVTTMVACGGIVFDKISEYISQKYITVVFLCIVAIISYRWNFARAVNLFYPIVSYVGIVYSSGVFVFLASYWIYFRHFNARNSFCDSRFFEKTRRQNT